jgi:hypothetical protein
VVKSNSIAEKFDVTKEEHYSLILSHLVEGLDRVSQSIIDLKESYHAHNNEIKDLISTFDKRITPLEAHKIEMEAVKKFKKPFFRNWFRIIQSAFAILSLVYVMGQMSVNKKQEHEIEQLTKQISKK